MALMVLSLATPLLSACSKNSSDTQVDLDSYQWAIFTSTYRNTGILPSPSSGYAIFVRDDGSYDLVSHSGMDSGEISWTQEGVHYADTNGEHWITKQGTTSVKGNRIDLMDALVTLSDGLTRVGVYNGGRQGKKYHEEVVVSRPGSSVHHKLETVGFYPMVSACGDNVYTAYSKASEVSNGRFIFDQIVDKGAVKRRNLNTQSMPSSEFSFYANDAPCAQNRIYFMGSFTIYDGAKPTGDTKLAPHMGRCPGGGEDECALALVVADANTGRLNWLPVVNENGSSEKFSSESAIEVGLDAHSLNEKGKLIWISGYGVLYETNVENGKTTVLNDALRKEKQSEDSKFIYHFSSDKNTVTVLVEDSRDSFAAPRIVVFDKSSGKIIKNVQIKGLKGKISDSLVIRDIASKPQ